MAHRITHEAMPENSINPHSVILIALLALTFFGCGATAPSRFYTLSSTVAADTAATESYSVVVGPVMVPAAVDRPQFVVQVAPNRVELNEFNRWAAPLNDAIARAVAGNLAALLGTPEVAAGPVLNFDPDYRVTIDVQRFESLAGEAAVIDTVWTVRATTGGETRTGQTTSRESVPNAGFDELAAAHSRALAKVSADIAAAIRRLRDDGATTK